MDEVVQAVENVEKEWDQTVLQIQEHVKAIEGCGKSGKGTEEANSLPRLNGAAQDGLASLRSMQFRLDLLSQQLPTIEKSQSAYSTLELWKKQYQK
ncbi:putative vesicle transport protein SEC20 [Cocos nucifera]|uniref:Putative vesicle transport protein SEC20 n=1 Tax=Cocos nucifera TaxID=13894 RepID=A0A8K0N793_COCNU|nr:putative vesicle transport protein SEC20 [Cocos nucifera]